jgi:hypothetical protein
MAASRSTKLCRGPECESTSPEWVVNDSPDRAGTGPRGGREYRLFPWGQALPESRLHSGSSRAHGGSFNRADTVQRAKEVRTAQRQKDQLRMVVGTVGGIGEP